MRNLFSPKRFLPLLLAGVAGTFVLVNVLGLGEPRVNSSGIAHELIRWTVVLTTFGLLAGILNLAAQHTRRFFRREPNWPYSLALLGGMIVVLSAGIVSALAGAARNPLESGIMQNLFTYIYTPLSASLIALLAFFGLSAAFRALGSGRREAVILVITAMLMLLLQLPMINRIPAVGSTVAWIQNYLAFAGAQALILGGAIGALVASIRVLMGVDRPYLDR